MRATDERSRYLTKLSLQLDVLERNCMTHTKEYRRLDAEYQRLNNLERKEKQKWIATVTRAEFPELFEDDK